MKHFFIILSIILSQNTYAQLPLGNDLVKGKVKLLNIMKDNGFNFIKEANNETFYSLFFKEEVSILIQFNVYENIELLNFSTGNRKILEKIKKIIDFNIWKYSYKRKINLNESMNVYRIHNYLAIYSYNPVEDYDQEGKHLTYQFSLFNEK
jgi:hypothetical protein